MVIGFDAKRILRNRTGLGIYGRTLINTLSEVAPKGMELRLYAPDKGEDDLLAQVRDSGNISIAYRPKNRLKFLWRMHGIVGDLQRDGVKLYHGLSGELPIGIHKSGIKSVVTIHDIIFLRHPEYYNRADVKIYSWKFHNAIRNADHIIAISECTKRDIMRYGNVPSSKIDVIYQSCSTSFNKRESESTLQKVGAKYSLPSRFIVSVGTIEERKNILLAVKALPLITDEVSLVVVGRSTSYCDKVKNFISMNNLGHRVLFLHDVSREDLPSIYQLAEAFVYPSRYEGFGIPIIEAVSIGLPVVTCTGSCLEEAGGPDSLYVDPDDVEGMAHAITLSLNGAEGREERIHRSMQYVKRFDGADVARKVLNLYNSLLEKVTTPRM